MTLGERCDEIVRLIDETLDGIGVSSVTQPPLDVPGEMISRVAVERVGALARSA